MWIIDALLPEFCVRCGREGRVFCSLCQAAWWPDPQLTHLKGWVGQHFSLGSYRDVVLQNLLRLWKYHGVVHAKEALLKVVQQTVHDYQPALPAVQVVSFVPLHWRKKNERGFDQAEETAGVVAATLGLPCVPLLTRQRYTVQQAQIERDKRNPEEFTGVFTSSVDVLPERVLLIDDVWTTGTTLQAAALALKGAGAREVHALTIAKG